MKEEPGLMATDNRIFSRNFAVYEEIRYENGPYSAVILAAPIRHRIQHRIWPYTVICMPDSHYKRS